MAEQLALDLGTIVAPAETIVSRCNEAAYILLDDWPRWSHPVMLVSGPQGAGKSHLAARFADKADGEMIDGAALSADRVLTLAARPLVVDDTDAADDRALFHLINAVRSAGSTLLLTATSRPFHGVLDLQSRLRAVPEVPLGAPDDALLGEVLRDGFLKRQLVADPQVINFLMTRMERTLHDAVDWVCQLDREALAAKKGPTRPLAVQVLGAKGGSRRGLTMP